MVSAAVTAASLGAISLDRFDFRAFFGRAVTFDAWPLAVGAALVAVFGPSVGTMKLIARRTASFRPSGGVSMANRVEMLGEPILGNSNEFAMAPWGREKAVVAGVLGFKHLVNSLCVGRVGKGARR